MRMIFPMPSLIFYKGLMGTSNTQRFTSNWDSLFTAEDHIDLSHLDNPSSEEQIKPAVFEPTGDKAPGPDGLHAFFY